MTLLLVSLFMGFIPMVVYTAILWWIDHWEREPLSLVIGCFIWGAVPSIIFALIWSMIFDSLATEVFLFGETQLHVASYAIIAPLTEEIAKGIGLLAVFLMFRREVDSLLDGILYGAVIGFGFAAVENVFYFTSFGAEGAVDLTVLVFLRAFLFGLNHAFFTGLTGLGFALARFQKNIALRVLFPLLGLGLAMVFHGLHNFFVINGFGGVVISFVLDWFGIFWVAVVIIWSLSHQGQLIRHYLKEEVQHGVLAREQAYLAGSLSHRLACGFGLFGHGITSRMNTHRLDQLCAELAFKKHQLLTMGDEKGNSAAIEQLRGQVAEVARQLRPTA